MRQVGLRTLTVMALAWLVAGQPAAAQYDPAKVKAEPAVVANRFPDPTVRYETPAFSDGRSDLTTHAEALRFLTRLASNPPAQLFL